jgi:hypothetical protein
MTVDRSNRGGTNVKNPSVSVDTLTAPLLKGHGAVLRT